MTERSVRCPVCPYSFARLVDAGNFHAYQCPTCGWTRPTEDQRPGNRPADVCAYCDRPINLTIGGHSGLHLYVGSGRVHGGGRDHIPVHSGCLTFEQLDYLLRVNPDWHAALACFRQNVGFFKATS